MQDAVVERGCAIHVAVAKAATACDDGVVDGAGQLLLLLLLLMVVVVILLLLLVLLLGVMVLAAEETRCRKMGHRLSLNDKIYRIVQYRSIVCQCCIWLRVVRDFSFARACLALRFISVLMDSVGSGKVCELLINGRTDDG